MTEAESAAETSCFYDRNVTMDNIRHGLHVCSPRVANDAPNWCSCNIGNVFWSDFVGFACLLCAGVTLWAAHAQLISWHHFKVFHSVHPCTSNISSILQKMHIIYLIHILLNLSYMFRCVIYTDFRENIVLHPLKHCFFTMLLCILHWLCHRTRYTILL